MKTLWVVPLIASSTLNASPITRVPTTLDGGPKQQIKTVSFTFDQTMNYRINTDIAECWLCGYDVSFGDARLSAAWDEIGGPETEGVVFDYDYLGGWLPYETRGVVPAGEYTLTVAASTWPGRYGDYGTLDAVTVLRIWQLPEPTSGVLLGALLPALLKRRR